IAGTPTVTANGTDPSNPDAYLYSSITGGGITITNGNTGNAAAPFAYVKIFVNGDITGKITIEKGVSAQIYFTGNMDVKAQDIDNRNVDGGTTPPVVYDPGPPPLIPETAAGDPNASRVGHLQFYGVAPDNGIQTINIDSPGNIFATFYAPRADI